MPIAMERYLVIGAPLVMIRLPRLQDWTMPYLPEKTGTVYHRHQAFFIEAHYHRHRPFCREPGLREGANGLFPCGLDRVLELTSFRSPVCRARRTPGAFLHEETPVSGILALMFLACTAVSVKVFRWE